MLSVGTARCVGKGDGYVSSLQRPFIGASDAAR
jgi:hypothetical protein